MAEGFTHLRPVEFEDLASTRAWRSDWEVVRQTLGRVFPITPENELAWYRGLGEGSFPTAACWVVEASSAIVGLVQLNSISWVHRTAWFGIMIAPEAQGAGHGVRATQACLDIAHTRMNLRQVRLEVVADNERALAVYARTGWVEEGRLARAVSEGQVFRDIVIMRHDAAG